MDTPVIKLSDEEARSVYQPAEDSFLLIDALEADLDVLRAAKPAICLEIGSGSGVVITALAMALKGPCKPYCIGIDINRNACKVTKETARRNSVEVDTARMDLLTCLRSDRLFDVIIFNPPYVVTLDEEISREEDLFKAWAGGKKGRKIMDRVFPRIPNALADTGTFYLLAIKENDPEEILRTLRSLNMRGEIVAERKIRGEHLYVLRFKKNT